MYHYFSSIKRASRQKGFTIIEVLIAMSVFTVIITIGIGAVLDTIRQHYVSQNSRTVMDSLNFIMEDMARNIRLGFNMRCGDPSTDSDGMEIPQSCAGSVITEAHNELSFNDQTGVPVTYIITSPSAGPSTIQKKKGTGPLEVITPPEVEMNFAHSGFTVRGAEAGDGSQPTVVIRLSGTIKYKDTSSTFAIETAVVLRALDS